MGSLFTTRFHCSRISRFTRPERGQEPDGGTKSIPRQSEQEVEKVRKLVERQYQLKEEFTREYFQAIENAEKRKRQAEIADKAGEAGMELFASNEYEEYSNRACRMKTARDDSAEQLEALEQKYEEMKTKVKGYAFKTYGADGKRKLPGHNSL